MTPYFFWMHLTDCAKDISIFGRQSSTLQPLPKFLDGLIDIEVEIGIPVHSCIPLLSNHVSSTV